MALREIRRKRKAEAFKFTERDMARYMGIPQSTYRCLEDKPSKLTYEQALKLSELLMVDPKELF